MNQSVTVIGAGIAGLSCAFDLARSGHTVHVVDALSKPGGVMGTRRIDGYQFETGPNSIPGNAASFLALCADAGLKDNLVPSQPAAQTRFLFADGRLQALPMKPGQLLRSRLLSWRSKLRLLTEARRTWRPTPGDEDPDFESFLTERFGEEIARKFGGSFVRGIYASESNQLGTASAFPKLMSLVQEHGSILRGMRSRPRGSGSAALLSLDGGLGQLPQTLATSLGKGLHLGIAATSIEARAGGWRTELNSGAPLDSDHLVLATPARPTERLLSSAGVPKDVLGDLASVTHASVRVAHLGFSEDFLPEGFGFLVPPDSPLETAPRALGVLFVSKMFADRAPAGGCAISAIYRDEELAGQPDEEVVLQACRDLRLALPGEHIPRAGVHLVQRWRDAIPRYAPGHSKRIEHLIQRTNVQHPHVHLIGNFTGGVSIDDRIRCGRECAASLAARTPQEGAA